MQIITFVRVILKLNPQFDGAYEIINKYAIQGFIYHQLLKTPFAKYHDIQGFKFFTYSDISPVSDYKKDTSKFLVISSPNPSLINTLYQQLNSKKIAVINGLEFKIVEVKKIRPKITGIFTTSSPIVLYKNNLNNEYFSFRKGGTFNFFIERLTENAIKKYQAYYNERINLEGNIFDKLVFRKEVAVNIYKNGIIGSMWKLIEKYNIDPRYRKFYGFIMDCGLGEKNSLGFGFINPVRSR